MKAFAGVLAFLAASGAAWGQSLLKEGAGGPYDPPRRQTYKKHDHIQVLVQERSRALSESELRTDRRSRWEVDLDNWIRFERGGKSVPRLRAAELTDDPGIDLDARYRNDNRGRTTREFDLTFTITAEVIDVRPNGTVVIQAIKRRRVNDDDELLRLSGEVAPTAIVNGRVRSDSIANLTIAYEGSGAASDVSKPGWLGWILGKLWPF